jgi:hypothetical protein
MHTCTFQGFPIPGHVHCTHTYTEGMHTYNAGVNSIYPPPIETPKPGKRWALTEVHQGLISMLNTADRTIVAK